MKLARKLKINDLTPIKFTEFEIKLIDFLENIIGNYDMYSPDNEQIAHNKFFMDIGGNYCFKYNSKTQNFYVRENWTWETLISSKLMNLGNLLDYLKWRMSKSLNVKIKTIHYGSRPSIEVQLIEDIFKTSDTFLKKRENISKLTYLDFLKE